MKSLEVSKCASALGRAGARARWGDKRARAEGPPTPRAAQRPALALPERASGLPMMVYVGQTRQRSLIAKLTAVGFGETVVRGEYPPRRHPWFYDNGAFRDFTSGRAFDQTRFEFELLRMTGSTAHPPPDFVILPDVVADAAQTFALSIYWYDRIRTVIDNPNRAPLSLALALQDGMTERDVSKLLPMISTLFVGGTRAWKWSTAARWAAFAHAHGKRLHIGRSGTPRLAKMAREANADSIDSAFPLWSRKHLDVFIAAIESGRVSREAESLEAETLRRYGLEAIDAASAADVKKAGAW